MTRESKDRKGAVSRRGEESESQQAELHFEGIVAMEAVRLVIANGYM